jgi:hypothetical protein
MCLPLRLECKSLGKTKVSEEPCDHDHMGYEENLRNGAQSHKGGFQIVL